MGRALERTGWRLVRWSSWRSAADPAMVASFQPDHLPRIREDTLVMLPNKQPRTRDQSSETAAAYTTVGSRHAFIFADGRVGTVSDGVRRQPDGKVITGRRHLHLDRLLKLVKCGP